MTVRVAKDAGNPRAKRKPAKRVAIPAAQAYALIGGHDSAPLCSCGCGLRSVWHSSARYTAGGRWLCPLKQRAHVKAWRTRHPEQWQRISKARSA